MTANRTVGRNLKANPTTLHVLLCLFLVCGFTLPGFSAPLDQDVVLQYNGVSITGSGYAPQIKSFGPGKIGIVSVPRKYVEWDRAQVQIQNNGVTRLETLPALASSNYSSYGGLAYHDGQPRTGGPVTYGTGSQFVEFIRTGTNTWTSSETGYTSPSTIPNFTYDVNPVTGDGAFFVKSKSVAVGNPDTADRLYVYRNAGAWTHSVIEQDRATDPRDFIRFSSDGTPWMFWNHSTSNTYKGGIGTPGATNFVDVGPYETGVGYSSNLAIDDNGVAHVVYNAFENGLHRLRYRKWTGSGWSSTSSSDYIVENGFQIYSSGTTVVGFAVGPDGVNKAILTRNVSTSDFNLYLYTWGPGSTSWTKTTIPKLVVTGGHLLTYDCLGNLYGFYIEGGTNYMRMMYDGNPAGVNLVKDSSFESSAPLHAERNTACQMYFDKMAVRDDTTTLVGAHHGEQVLNYRTFVADCHRPILFLNPVTIAGDRVSFTAWVRGRASGTIRMNVYLYNGPANYNSPNRALLVNQDITYNDTWQQVQFTTDPQAINPQGTWYLGISFVGPSSGCEVDIDQVGLFDGGSLPQAGVGDSAEFHVMEAEELATGTSWVTTPHVAGATGNPASGLETQNQILTGQQGLTNPQDAVWNLNVKNADTYKLWVRFHHYPVNYVGGFTVEIRQNGSLLGELPIEEWATKYGPNSIMVWESLPLVNLQPGPVEVRLKRPAAAAGSWTTRRVDVLCLTNNLAYVPEIQDFLEPVYMRYRNTTVGGEPYYLHVYNHCDLAPALTIGALSKGGVNLTTARPYVTSMMMGPGEASAWVRITPYLRRNNTIEHLNRLQLTAKRGTTTYGYEITEPFTGELQFAVGPQKQIIDSQTVVVDQTGPMVRVTVNGDIARYPEQIKHSWEFLQPVRDRVTELMEEHDPITALEVCTGVELIDGKDDQELLAGEFQALLDMGCNNIYINNSLNLPIQDKASYGLRADSGVYLKLLYDHPCYSNLNKPLIDTRVNDAATSWSGLTDTIHRNKDADEFEANSISHVVGCSHCITGFQNWLKGANMFGEDGYTFFNPGFTDWEQVLPVSYSDRTQYPKQYYYTQLYRFEALRAAAAYCQDMLDDRFPNARNYNTVSDDCLWYTSSWVSSNYDLFTSIRDGFGMGFSEDWNIHGIGPVTDSFLTAMLRSACRPEGKPFGMYAVHINPGIRTKIYEIASSGATCLNLYNYGPAYSGVNVWAPALDYYQNFMEPLAELGRADDGFKDSTRLPAQIAILYNRTAGIWDSFYYSNSTWYGNEYAWELDAQFVYYALRHAGYNVDVIPEEDVEDAGTLAGYAVLYVNGPHMRQQTATAISNWINTGSGKVLVGTAGVGNKNAFDGDTTTLNDVFGITGSYSNLQRLQLAGRPKYESPALTVQTTATVNQPANTPIKVVCWRENLTPLSGTVTLGTDTQSNIVATKRIITTPEAGTNFAVRYGFLPGLGYVRDAWDQTASYNAAIPVGYDGPVADAISYGAGLVLPKVAEAKPQNDPDPDTLLPMFEFTRFDKTVNDVHITTLFVINHNYNAATQTVWIEISACENTTSVTSARPGNTPTYTDLGNGKIRIELSMDRTSDILTITH
jgi:hypothetical protein